MPEHSAVIELEDVQASRPGSSFTLRVDHLAVAPGEFVALTGPSGSGKSTVLDVAAGLMCAQRGRVRVAGLDLAHARARRRVRTVGAYLAQQGTVVDFLTVAENLALSASIAGMRPDPARLIAAIAQLGLEPWRDRRAAQLSGGQRQRVALAAAVYRRSPVVWADEPTSALDEENTLRVFAGLQRLCREQGSAVLCVTHDVAQVSGFADRSHRVADGMLATGSHGSVRPATVVA